MRPLILSVGCWALLAGAAQSQSKSSDANGVSQLPVGQIYKDFEFPMYQDGKLSFTLSARDAKGITINRAETNDLKIDLYTNGKVTTTITSPNADLYVADRKMRTRNTVHIVRADMDATGQICDFDLADKQYTLRTNVKVVLKNFDAASNLSGKVAGSPGKPVPAAPAAAAPRSATASLPPLPPLSAGKPDTLMDSPGSISDTNAAPLPQ